MKRLFLLLAIMLVFSVFGIMGSAQATQGPDNYNFQGYDLTQVTTWSNTYSHCSDPCHIPLINATSHFGTTMNTQQGMLHYWTPLVSYQYIFAQPLTPQLGQGIGVICWTTSSNLGIVDKIDARFNVTTDNHIQPQISGSYLFIGYEDDDYVNLSYSDRINYVPHC